MGNNRNNLNLFNVITVNEDKKSSYYIVDDALIGSMLLVYESTGRSWSIRNQYYANQWLTNRISSGQYLDLR